MKTDPLDELIFAYFDRQLTAGEQERLEAQLRGSTAARKRFHEAVRIHALLSRWGVAERACRESQDDMVRQFLPGAGNATGCGKRPARPGFRRGILGLAAACVALLGAWGMVSIFKRAPADPPTAGLATTGHSRQVAWSPDSALPRDGFLARGRYVMKAGMLRLDMKGGAHVVIAGPSEFHLHSGSDLELARGKLTAHLPEKEATLAVRSAGMTITDLGTSFGLQIGDKGGSLVSVFDGRVRIDQDLRSERPLLLGQGQSMTKGRNSDAGLQSREFTSWPFSDLWPLTLGVEEVSSLVVFIPPGPLQTPLREHADLSHLFLFPERQNVTLDGPLAVDLTRGGATWPEDMRRIQLAAGRRVSSYLLFYNPPKAPLGSFQSDQSLAGDLSFDREIVGVITEKDSLLQSDEVVGFRGIDYGGTMTERTLESTVTLADTPEGPLAPDILRISEDRRSIYFVFNVRPGFDQIRILLEDQKE